MNKEIEGEFVSNTCSLLIYNASAWNYNQISFIFGIINYTEYLYLLFHLDTIILYYCITK